ncbi:uncharacterized protein LOC119188889 [Manduca sexta]|uniref:uncharacterized protein LOC119188889 n=1 Tax=Manduca sexta TaxID=7130 RepID=UPI00188FF23E|nr:uncharacterized protein LOC119188889 [Manduca sexta]
MSQEDLLRQVRELQEELAKLQTPAASSDVKASVFGITMKLPPFWHDKPAIWFAQAEAQFEIAGISQDSTKYGHILSKLDTRVATELEDVIENPPTKDKYNNLKSEVIKRFGISRDQRVRQLLSDEPLGDRKPSSFLRHLQTLAGAKSDENIIRELWMRRLPSDIQHILMAQIDLPLQKVADIADAIMDTPVNVSCPIIGSDFLAHYHLLPDCRQQRLVDGISKLSSPATVASAAQPAVKSVIAGDSAFKKILLEFPDLTRPPGQLIYKHLYWKFWHLAS